MPLRLTGRRGLSVRPRVTLKLRVEPRARVASRASVGRGGAWCARRGGSLMPLIARAVGLEAIVALRPLLAAIARHDRALAKQGRDAANSMLLNIAEAERSDPGTGRPRLHNPDRSTREARAA